MEFGKIGAFGTLAFFARTLTLRKAVICPWFLSLVFQELFRGVSSSGAQPHVALGGWLGVLRLEWKEAE